MQKWKYAFIPLASVLATTGIALAAHAPGHAPPLPPDTSACKNGGWMTASGPDEAGFKNQGDCVSSVASGGKAKGNP